MTEPVIIFGLTASNVLALAGISLSAFLGFLAYKTGKDARDDARAMATETRAADERRARVDRIHANRRETYVDMLEHLYRTQDYVNRTEPIMSMTGDPPPPEWPSEDVLRRLNARVATYGSPEILTRLEASTRLAAEFQGAVFLLRVYRESRDIEGGAKTMDAWKDVEAKRVTYNDACKAIRELANQELSE